MAKKTKVLVIAIGLVAAAFFVYWRAHSAQPSNTVATNFNKHLYSTDQAGSLWAVVNKGRVLPSNYEPNDLVVPKVALSDSSSSQNMLVRAQAAQALQQMFAAASAKSIKLMLVSGYRSYDIQQSVYSGYVSSVGQTSADVSSARPGHSEHQTGLAADIGDISRNCQLEQCFDATPAGKWLSANAYKYGFIIRYRKDKQSLTGYEYEPWHIRYVGEALAGQINKTGQTLEQFFGLPAFSAYPAQSFELHSD
jgi:D-alanyl-D-alanine carboxypeptidase